MANEKETVWLGIDWADQKHRWAMRIDGETRVQQGELDHTPEAVDAFVLSLATRFPGQRVAVALEQSRGALIFMLGKYEHLVLYPIHPNALDQLSQECVSLRRKERSCRCCSDSGFLM